MEASEVLLMFIGIILWIGFAILSGFFIYWTARILIIIPDCLRRITAAIEKWANK